MEKIKNCEYIYHGLTISILLYVRLNNPKLEESSL